MTNALPIRLTHEEIHSDPWNAGSDRANGISGTSFSGDEPRCHRTIHHRRAATGSEAMPHRRSPRSVNARGVLGVFSRWLYGANLGAVSG